MSRRTSPRLTARSVSPLTDDRSSPGRTEITSGTFQIDACTIPLTDIETAWKDTDSNYRLVITP